MTVTRNMRLQRAMKYLEAEKTAEEKSLKAMEGVHITEVIVIRNKKAMYIAELDQMIRNIRADLAETTLEEELRAEVRE